MAYRMRNGLRPGSSKRLMIGPGALYKNFNLATFDPSDENTWGELLGATKGGNEFESSLEWHQVEVDGALGTVEGMEWLIKAEAKLTTNLLEITKDNLLMKLPGFGAYNHDDNYEILKHDGSIAPTMTTNLALVGEITGKAIPVIIVLEQARCVDAFNLNLGNGKDDVVLKAEFQARFSESDPTRIPFYILYPKGGSNVAAPVASPAPGVYDGPIQVSLAAAAGVDIYYTTDGSIPTPSTGTKYTGPINIAATTTLKAIAVQGVDTSSVVSFQYTINN